MVCPIAQGDYNERPEVRFEPLTHGIKYEHVIHTTIEPSKVTAPNVHVLVVNRLQVAVIIAYWPI